MTLILELLNASYTAREAFFDQDHFSAFRLFNGFLEGMPCLSVDIYARTALIHNYAASTAEDQTEAAHFWITNNLPWVQCIIVKTRQGQTTAQRRGDIIFGKSPDRKILENGIFYALDLTLNRDASLYLDTRNLRSWAQKNLAGKTVLNTFAYTGSLGVAALAGRAARVVQLDRSAAFLDLARQSCELNNLRISQHDFLTQDFFPAVGQLKQSRQLFDCVFIDPPFFASTSKGTVDLEKGSTRLINKIRPLVCDGGWLVTINNALYVSGQDYFASIQALCNDGYLSIEELIPIPPDFTGFVQTRRGSPPVNPAPFNHSTKIVILRVRRKSI